MDNTGSVDPDLSTTQWERMVNELTVARSEVRYLET
jgi:hypothetical protein